jgi:phosphatidylserine/phosphatidylglycerophosphate/cardiolipin synthase-like enzyme
MVPFLSVLEKLIRKKVAIRLIHAKEPGTNFRKDFDKYPLLWKNLERICCPRVHFKTVIIDGVTAYTGSANLTGAGMGAKKAERRNFENGILTDDPQLVDKLMRQFDDLWIGKDCKNCQRREFCVDRIDGL